MSTRAHNSSLGGWIGAVGALILANLATSPRLFCSCFVPTAARTTTVKTPPAPVLLQAAASMTSSPPLLSYQHVKGVIFDVDGTLADSWKLGFDATLAILEKNGIPSITAETYHECTRYATPDRLARHAGLLPERDGAEYESVGQRLAAEFDDLYVDLVSMQTAAFYKGMHQLIESIPKGVAVGALTNAAERYAHAVLETNCPVLNDSGDANKSGDSTTSTTLTKTNEQSGIYHRFQSIRGADTVPKPKPAPDGLFQVCQELGLSPAECVYIGDSPSDGASAQNAGMPAIGVLWGSHSKSSLLQAPFSDLCHTVKELQALLPQVETTAVTALPRR